MTVIVSLYCCAGLYDRKATQWHSNTTVTIVKKY